MKKALILIAMVCVLTLSFCMGVFAESAEAPAVDFTLFPETLDKWTVADIKNYMKACGVMTNDTWFFDLTSGDLTATHSVAGTIYMDFETAAILDIVYQLNTAEDPVAVEMLADISKTQKIVINGDLENAQDVDAVLGNFCFQYLMGFDEAHVTALCQAIRDLAAHYGVEPVYVNDWNTVPAV